MFVDVRFQFPGDAQYARRFEAFAADVDDLTEPLRRIADDLRGWVGEQFLTEGARGGTPWAPLTPRYAEWKEEHYPGRPLLVRTGKMRGRLLDHAAFTVEPRRMVYAPDSDIAGYHQDGTTKMVARPPVVVTEEDKRAIDREFLSWLRHAERRTIGT